ncbi:HlyD family efflux transporter periplasmic adaptor subunit [Pseudoalteromonas sp. OOF1S-7]|uniref:efflux RND transporter periplasmic adaptor subunit n=1 Tax=Pseudoalteromonas sp. OOF1S-7 TaxID=2917757 RepID=UPI001EF44BD7|nr:HlyD family efflux transporter periplasmic adaptor subunit [Pseudoalteromonas sp. OOF1S-7]MCG7536064.1 HlyD family secretion protein [Pseudoalteromonas sp. OOF1S-7]
MDLIKPPEPTSYWRRWQWGGVPVILLIGSWLLGTGEPITRLARQDVLIATVEYGPLAIGVDSFGVLRSAEQHLLSVESDAVVKHIHLKAGAAVKVGDVIATLDNPDLSLAVAQAQQARQDSDMALQQLTLNQQREFLSEQTLLDKLTGDLATARLREQAEQGLAEKGIISQLAFAQTRSRVANLARQRDSAQQRLAQLKKLHASAQQLASQRIAIRRQELARSRARLAALTVTAPVSGILERMPLAVGQRLKVGDEAALIGSQTRLLAELRVAQSQVQKVQPGQAVTVRIRDQQVPGTVKRIDPVVVENSVKVEVALPRTLPKAARPMLSIDASITVAELEQALYIRRPANVREQQSAQLYRLAEDGSTELKTVHFGALAGRYVVIEQGAKHNQRWIISDLSSLAQQGVQVALN